MNKALKAGLSEFRDHLYLAIAHQRKRQAAAFAKEMAALERIRSEMKIEPSFLAKLGTVYARAGMTEEAERILANVRTAGGDLLAASGVARSSQSDQAAFHRLQGEIELARGKYDEALASFEMAGNLRDYLIEDTLALTYKESGDIDKAIEKYEEFLGKDVLGYEAQDVWSLAPYELGKLYEARGDAAAAAKWYERFLESWKDADPDIAEVADAKRRLARLPR